jgi:c-di-GMP-binding flagellar brake protein YcgR
MSDEKRRSPRVSYLCEVACDMFPGDTPQTLRLSDISAGGAFIDSMAGLPIGACVALTFSAGAREVRVRAEVVQSMPQFGIGVRFLDLSEEDRAAIEQLVLEQGG